MQAIPTTPFTSEVNFLEKMQTEIADFWQTRDEGQLVGKDGLRLYWCAFRRPEHKRAIVIVNGRIEACIKYQELMFDLFQQGYDIYNLDHRGQGFSQRLVSGSTIGHVVKFKDYVADLDVFIENVVKKTPYEKHFLLAHSMGSAISLRYAQTHPAFFDAMALSSPMLGIPLPFWLKPIATTVTQVLANMGHPATFSFGQRPFYVKPFEITPLTHCQVRYQWFGSLYQNTPQIQVGGASHQWVRESLKACKKIRENIKDIPSPLLILQADKDKIVCNKAMNRFVKAGKRAKKHVEFARFSPAKHELFVESDPVRDSVLTTVLTFFNQWQ